MTTIIILFFYKSMHKLKIFLYDFLVLSLIILKIFVTFFNDYFSASEYVEARFFDFIKKN